jgi:catechol 2,3-dioxygenase-like lactoylglutathione lyase family enzyme
MPVKLENVGIAVRDLDAAIAFFTDLGLTVLGRARISGEWADTAVGLDGNTADIAVLQTVLSYVSRCNASGHGPSANQIRGNVPTRNFEVDAERRRLVSQGRLRVERRAGRGGGFAHWVSDAEPRQLRPS